MKYSLSFFSFIVHAFCFLRNLCPPQSHEDSLKSFLLEVSEFFRSVCVQSPSGVHLFVTPTDCRSPRASVDRIPRQECWRGPPFPFPGRLPNPGTDSVSPALVADSCPLRQQGSPRTLAPLSKINLQLICSFSQFVLATLSHLHFQKDF